MHSQNSGLFIGRNPRTIPPVIRPFLRACLKILKGAAARDFGCGQGGEAGASPQRAVTAEPTQATGKRPAARRVFAEKAVWLRCSSVEDPPGIFSLGAPPNRPFSAKTAPFIIFRQALRRLCGPDAIIAVGCWLALVLCGPAFASDDSNLVSCAYSLTNAAQIHNLPQADAAKRLPAKLRGVVVGEAEPGGRGFALQDGSGGIYLETTPATVATLHPGDLIEAEGVSDPGNFAPFLAAASVRKIGTAELPPPRRVTFEDMTYGKVDAQWVEVSGIVRFCERSPNDTRKCRIELATGGGRLIVRWNVPSFKTPLVDAEVRLRGVCYYLVNRSRQLLSPMLAIPHDVPVIIEVPPPANPFDVPVRSVGSLLRFAGEGCTTGIASTYGAL